MPSSHGRTGSHGPGCPVPDALAYLAGAWHVERLVRDLDGGAEGRFTGRADFTAERPQGALRHVEEGSFTWGGVTRPATREHRFEPAGDGTALVRFTDGRLFHPLDLRTGTCVVGHPCAADHYRGEFTVLGEDRWRVVWRVSGPAKDLLLTTVHSRIGGGPEPV
ncbi:DUF6314 family protein [Streptantibioticus parmotrematis]|uniref:DUF6314 family protein n=1 Tax=Streptantibioticus parmotrematis TaxID=2873249 RepID=UPI0033D9647B